MIVQHVVQCFLRERGHDDDELNASSPKTIVVKCIEEKWGKKKNTVAKCPLCC